MVSERRGVGQILRTLVRVMSEAVKRRCQFHQLGLNRGIMRRGALLWLAADPGERCVIMMPARVQADHIWLALAQRTGGARPTAQLDIAGVVELGFIVADQRF